MRNYKLSTLTLSFAMAGMCGLNLLTGCAAGTAASLDSSTGHAAVSISGSVHGGQNPIGGSKVQLWETTTTGYGVAPAASLIASTTTAAGTGAFSFGTANVPANCTTGPFAYITATGGDSSGVTTTNTNPGVALVAMLGSCATTGASTTVTLNEVTTVAAAYALSGFATDANGTIGIGTTSTNAQGLKDAVANAALLANTGTGAANASTTSMFLPTAMVNSLANALAACVNTAYTGTSFTTASTNCANLFSYTTPPGTTTAPADTFQAAVNMARYPGSNVSNILSLGAAAGAPFVPSVATTTVTQDSATVVGTAPNDLTLGIAIPSATLQNAQYGQYVTSSANNPAVSLAIDSADNIWILGATNGTLDTSHYNYIWEQPAASSSTTPGTLPSAVPNLGTIAAVDGTHTIRFGAFDKSDNFFLSDKNASGGALIEIASGNSASSGATELASFSGLSVSTPPGGSLEPNDWTLAIDPSGNLFTSAYGGQGNCVNGTGTTCEAIEYPAGSYASPTNVFGTAQIVAPTVRGIAEDAVSTSAGTGNVWLTNYSTETSTKPGTSVEVLTPSTGALSTITIGSGTTASGSPLGVALDKSGNAYITTTATAATSGLWKVPQGTATGSTISSVVSTSGQAALTSIPYAAAASTGSANYPTAASPLQIGGLSGPGYLAVDGAGNVFVANYTYGSVVEYSPALNAYLSPYYGFAPSLTPAAATYTAQQITLYGSGTSVNLYGPIYATVGQTVTLSGFSGTNYSCLNNLAANPTYPVTALGATAGSYVTITIPLSQGCSTTTIGKAAATGTVLVNSGSNQAVFTCTASATSTCSISGSPTAGNNVVGIDRAGTIWTMPATGILTGIIGTAAPTDPVLADGRSGSQP